MHGRCWVGFVPSRFGAGWEVQIVELYVIILNLSILLNLFSKIEHLKSCKLFTVEFALNPPPLGADFGS